MDKTPITTSTTVLEETDAGPPANNTDSGSPTTPINIKLATVPISDPSSEAVQDIEKDHEAAQDNQKDSEEVQEKDDEAVQEKGNEAMQKKDDEGVQEKDDEGVQETKKESKAVQDDDGGDDGAKPTEQEETPPVDVEEVRTRAYLEAQIRRLNDRVQGYEKLHRAKDKKRQRAKEAVFPWGEARRRRRGSDASVSVSSVDTDDLLSDDQVGDRPGEQPKANVVLVPQLNRVPWETFYGLRSNNGAVASPFAIDVLVGDPEPEPSGKLYLAPGRIRGAAPPGYGFGSPGHHTKTPGKAVAPGRGLLPERIRINSSAIVKILNKIIGQEGNTAVPMLMMEPFRALVHYKDEIRSWKARLEARLGKTTELETETDDVTTTDKPTATEGQHKTATAGNDEDDSKPKDESGPAPDTPPADKDGEEGEGDAPRNKKALDDLNCLIEFIDTDLEGRLAYLASDGCERVSFSDIWHLFKPGDVVLSKDRKQAYRVINVKYPKHVMILPSPRDYWVFGDRVRLEDSPITIQCVYVDSDGEQIGPVPHTISIPRFDGERNILSLDIIPLRLANKDGALRDKLIKRGASFIQACGTGRGGVPMHYSGLTLDTEEEVDSQVVIDFEEAFSANDGGGRNRARPGMTLEQGVLDLVAQSIIQDIDDSFLRQKAKELKWKPVIGRIDAREQDDDEADSESDKSRHGGKKKCIPECCAKEVTHDETYVERNRRNEFIQSQFLQQGTRSGLREPSLTIAPRPLKEAMEDENFIGDSERLIASYRVFGFIMRSRKWGEFVVHRDSTDCPGC